MKPPHTEPTDLSEHPTLRPGRASWPVRLGGALASWTTVQRLGVLWWWSRYLRTPTLAVVLGLALALIVGEVMMRALPLSSVPSKVGNIMFTCYQPEFPERFIYADAMSIDQRVHQPHRKSECYYNGYFWEHQSDAFGWRNPETWDQVEVVLLGDSMIYGHGVEEHQTVAHFLRELLGVRVANQAMFASSPGDYLAIYQNFSLPLQPKVTIVTVYANDLSDLRLLPPDKLDRFAATGDIEQARRYRRADLLETLRYPEVSTLQRWAGRSRLYSLLGYYVPARQTSPKRPQPPGMLQPLPGPDPAEQLAGLDFRGNPNEWYGRELGFTRRVIATMAAAARAHDTTLVVSYLPGHHEDLMLEDVRIPMILARFAEEADVPYFWAGGTLANEEGTGPRPGTRLPFDGHLTELGNRLVAEELARFLRRHVPALVQ